MTVRIAVLGTTEVVGSADPTPLTRRDRVVLGALTAAAGETLSTEQLADALWHDDPPKSAAKVVQGSVMRLRRMLGAESIETTSGGYRFTLDGDTVDSHLFEQLVARARGFLATHQPERAAASYEQALALWRGAAFAELQEWDLGRAEAERLLEVRRSAEEELVEARMLTGHTAAAVAEAQHLVRREPYREHRWALLALALYRSGRQREALDALRRARRTMVDELGLDPGPELVTLEQQILQQDASLLDVPDAPVAASGTCPWPGLRPFDTDQSELFAGREDEVASCLDRLSSYPLLVVVGASGSGKSSLVRAGVVPALREAGDVVAVVAPGAAPNAALETALAAATPPDVLVVDQLEELFVSPNADDAMPFLVRLASLVDDDRRVVITLRADYLAGLSSEPGFARQAERGLVLLAPMDEAQVRRAIEDPAARSGLVLEHGLVDLLVRDVVHEPGGLPLMSHALAETWSRRDMNVLTVDGYTSTGGIRGAVAQSAERLYESLDPQGRVALRGVLHRLVTPMASGEPVAARVSTRVFDGTSDATRVLDRLVRARLVTTSADTATIAHESLVRAWPRLRSWLDEDVEGQRVLAHLQVAADGWEASGRPEDELYRGARLSTAAEWRDRSTPLLSATESDFLAASSEHATAEEERRTAALLIERRRNRQLRWSLGGVAGLLALALAAGSLAAVNGRRAAQSAARAIVSAESADAGRLAFASQSQRDSGLSQLLARQAVEGSPDPAVRGNLLRNLLEGRVLSSANAPANVDTRYHDHQFSPDGRRALVSTAAPDDGPWNVALLDVASGKPVGTFPLVADGDDYSTAPYPTGFIDHGKRFLVQRAAVSRLGDDELVTFDTATGRQVGDPEPVPGSRNSGFFDRDLLRVSADGSTVTSVLDRSLRVWRRAGSAWAGPIVTPLPPYPPSQRTEDFATETRMSQDGSRIFVRSEVTGNDYRRLGIALDTRSRHLVGPYTEDPTDVSVSPDGSRMAVARADGTVALTDAGAGGTLAEIPGSTAVSAIGWSSDSGRLALGDQDGEVRVLALDPLREVAHFRPTGNAVVTIALPEGGATVTTIESSSRITVRSLSGASVIQEAVSTPGQVARVSAGPAGTVVAAGFYKGVVSVYDQRTLTLRRTLNLGPWTKDPTINPDLHRRVTALAVTPDGGSIIAADRTGHLRMWDASTGRLEWSRDDVPTSWLAVSPDGKYLATEEFSVTPSDDPTSRWPDTFPTSSRFRLWDLRTREPVLVDDLPGEIDQDGHTPKPRVVVFSPDSSLVATGYFAPIPLLLVYDVRTGKRVLERGPEAGSVAGAAFTNDGRGLLVSDDKGKVSTIDPRTGVTLASFSAAPSPYSSLAFTTDGALLATYSQDSFALWDAATYAPVASFQIPGSIDGDAPLAATSDGHLFVGTRTGLLRIDTSFEHWKAAACAIADRPLSSEEWMQFLPDRPYAPTCTSS